MTALDRGALVGRARRRRFQLGVGKLLFLVACVAAMLGAWRFRRENSDVERVFTSRQVYALGRGKRAEERRAAALGLAEVPARDVGIAVAALCEAVSDPDAFVRAAAAQSLGMAFRRGVAASQPGIAQQMDAASATLLAALQDPNAGVRKSAAEALSNLSAPDRRRRVAVPLVAPDPRVVLPPLIEAVRDPDPAVRAAVVHAIGVLAPESGNAPPVLLAALDADRDQGVRAAAAQALGHPWRDADAVFLALVARLGSLDHVERVAAGRSLRWLNSAPLLALPRMIEALKAPNNSAVRDVLPEIIGRLGARARPALPVLADVARQQFDQGWSITAADALAAIDPDSPEAQSTIAPLVAMILLPGQRGMAGHAAITLARFGASAKAAVAPLRAARNYPDAEIRSRVEWTLEQIDPQP